jgi:hypothetical protein
VDRIHLFELEDQPWFPAVWRNAGTAYLRLAADVTGQPSLMVPKLAQLLGETGDRHLVDLCSGGAGPVPAVIDQLKADEGLEVSAVLTDLYPNVAQLEAVAARSQGQVTVHPEPVDATQVPDELDGCRTLFNALHHFRPEAARGILQSAVDAGQPIAAFDVPERTLAYLLGILFAPIVFALACPFLRPFDWRWIVFTYLIPIIPLFVVWDGFVSGLRAYSVSELDALINEVEGDYLWETGRLKVGRQPAHITYLMGWPPDYAQAVAGSIG